MIFSIQIVSLPSIVKDISSFVMYLTGDILFGYTILCVVFILVSASFLLSTVIASSIFYIKEAKKFKTVFSICCKTIFWILSACCLFYILAINKYLYSSQSLGRNLVVFYLALMISSFKIVENIFEFKKRLND